MPGRDLDLGPCQVTFDGTDLGNTEGGVVFTISTTVTDLYTDQLGTTPAEQVITGRGATVVVPMAQSTLARLVAIHPGWRLVSDSGTPANQKIVMTQGVGTSALGDSAAKQLVIKPYAAGAVSTAATTDKWVTLPKAMPSAEVNWTYGKDQQRIATVTFTILPDPDQANILGHIGDTTAQS